jgi:hypothetical protein
MIKTNLLWNHVIESDGRVHREETFLGAVLAFGVLVIGLGILAVLFL